MKTLLGTLALSLLVASGAGCYVSRHSVESCDGGECTHTEWGIGRPCSCRCTSPCGEGCWLFGGGGGIGCDVACDTACAPECGVVGCDHVGQFGEGYYPGEPQYLPADVAPGPLPAPGPHNGPQPTFGNGAQPGPSNTPMPMPMPEARNSTGWQPTTAVHPVHHVHYPIR